MVKLILNAINIRADRNTKNRGDLVKPRPDHVFTAICNEIANPSDRALAHYK